MAIIPNMTLTIDPMIMNPRINLAMCGISDASRPNLCGIIGFPIQSSMILRITNAMPIRKREKITVKTPPMSTKIPPNAK